MICNKPSIHCSRFILILLTGLGGTGCVNHPAPVESYYNRGVALYDQGKYTEAIDAYKLALRKNPKDLFAKYNLAVVYQDRGKLDRAVDLYKEILNDAEDTNSRINIAAVYYGRGQRDLAFGQLKTAAQNNGDSPEPLSALGEYLERKEDLDQAEKLYGQALAIDDQHALTYYRLGRLSCHRGKKAPCMENLGKAVELSPKTPSYLEALATRREKEGDNLEAINLLERVSILEPDRAEIFILLGNLYKSEKLYKNAIKSYWSAVAIKDADPGVHGSLAEIYGWLREFEMQELKAREERNSLAKTPGPE